MNAQSAVDLIVVRNADHQGKTVVTVISEEAVGVGSGTASML